MTNSFSTFKEEGNAAYKEGEWEKALSCYLAALKLTSDFSTDRATILKNRAAVNLKLNKFNEVIKDCEEALDIVPDDPKTLFRRCQALENVGRYEEAYRDAKDILRLDPSNKLIQPTLARLHKITEDRLIENCQTENKIKQMYKYVFGLTEDPEKRVKAVNNLLYLAKESFSSSALLKEGVCERIAQLLKVETNNEIRIGCIRTVGALCDGSLDHTKIVIQTLGVPWFLDIINCKDSDQVAAAQYCLQILLNSLGGIRHEEEDSKGNEEMYLKNKSEIDTLLTCLVYSCTSRTMTGLGRDAIIQLISRNVHYRVINWADQLVKIKGLQRIMEVASELLEYKYESAMEITESTRAITSVCLARVYENMYYDEARTRFLENIDDYVKSKLITPDIESKVRVVVAVTTLLLGPVDVGNTVISKEGILQMILVMAGTDDVLQQKVACECIIAAATKKDKVTTIIAEGVNILKRLYQSKDDTIRVRALVGLCKLGSSGGTDASIRPFADGATTRLAEACRRFLIHPSKDNDIKRWAAEGLSYLTLDADVKEKLIEDKTALKALFELAKTKNQSAVYGVITTIVNLVNAYEKEEILPELLELARFAKHHIPQNHELDDPDFITKRCTILVEEGVVTALVALSNVDSYNCREMLCRVFNMICGQQELRGITTQQGGVKALLGLAHEGNEKGKKQAAQALARIGITINPEVAFPGQRAMEVIRPLISLLHPECSALENFESLMALCNLASMSESVRTRIIKEGGVSKIEIYMLEEHMWLRRAATQAMTNLICSPQVVSVYEGNNDKTKLLFLLTTEEDEETSLAAAGALAMLTSVSPKCCSKIFEANKWLENLQMILATENLELQHRAVIIVNNVIRSSKECAEKLMETNIMEILMALTLLKDGETRCKIAAICEEALTAAKKMKVITTPGQNNVSAT